MKFAPGSVEDILASGMQEIFERNRKSVSGEKIEPSPKKIGRPRKIGRSTNEEIPVIVKLMNGRARRIAKRLFVQCERELEKEKKRDALSVKGRDARPKELQSALEQARELFAEYAKTNSGGVDGN